ncbi:MAG: Maf family nucleotide pyrophosphatase [Candidatus Moranbacteria bacterium]|jgi:septum formation protein|nr:Maf family nucleotide pyrophosphatase [Candidatus Moranbacteria bacterium]
MKKIILATTSPYRQELFRLIGIEFEAIGSDVDEKFDGRPNGPDELVEELARQKAQAVAEKVNEGIVVGFDSVGWFDGKILEKPKSKKDAEKRLQNLSGSSFQFYTGIFLIDAENGRTMKSVVKTDVNMRDIDKKEIEKYLSQDDKFSTYALGFDPLGHYSATFVKNISGSYNNLTRGIPIECVIEMLKKMGAIID